MKNIFLICLTLMVVLFTFSACHSEKMETGATDVTGQLSLASMKMEVDLKVDTVYPQSRAGVDVSNFLLTIKNSQGEQVEQYTYSEMPEIISLPVGTYTVVASSAEAATNGFDVPFYTGSTEQFTIKENELTEVSALTCRLANVMISVEYDEELRKLMGEDVVTTVTIKEKTQDMIIKEYSLDIPSSETRKAYLIAPASVSPMDITLKGTIDGEFVTEVNRVDEVQAGQYNIIKYTLSPVDDGNNSVGGNLNIAINVDSSMTSSDETVGVNPGEEPGIDDFPTDGGEEPGDGDGDSDGDGEGGITSDINITGKKLGDSSFDIDQTQTITGATTLIVGIEAPAGIQNLKVTISSDNEEFGSIGASFGTFDLANPGDKESMIAELGLPYGTAVKDKTELDFDISTFTALLTFEGTHTFYIAVTDNQGKTESKSLVINVPKK